MSESVLNLNLRSTKTNKPICGLVGDWPSQVAKKGSVSQKPTSEVCTVPPVTAYQTGTSRPIGTSCSTRTSNAIIKPARGLKTKDNAAIGLFEESEESECQAALNSLVKGKIRLTCEVCIFQEKSHWPSTIAR